MIINKKSFYTISDILEKYNKTMSFRIVVNKKFYIEAKLEEFHNNCYKEAICKFKHLPLLNYRIENYYNKGKYIVFFVESNDFEEEILKIENEWYEKNHGKIIKKKGENLWI